MVCEAPIQDDPLDAASLGSLVWFSSYEDSGPDVGVGIKLGDNKMLWCGEITSKRYRETEGCAALGDEFGWWIIFYDGPATRVIGKCIDSDAAQDAFALIATLPFVNASPEDEPASVDERAKRHDPEEGRGPQDASAVPATPGDAQTNVTH